MDGFESPAPPGVQVLDSRVAGLERKLEAIPTRIHGIRDGLQQAKASVDAIRGKLDGAARTCGRRKRARVPGRPAEEARGQALRGQDEQGVLGGAGRDREREGRKGPHRGGDPRLMELQERVGREVVEADARLRPQEAEAKVQEAAAAEELRALEVDVRPRGASEGRRRDVPRTCWCSTRGSSRPSRTRGGAGRQQRDLLGLSRDPDAPALQRGPSPARSSSAELRPLPLLPALVRGHVRPP